MLQAIRTQAGSFIVKLLFGFLILSFAVWGIGDIFRGGSSGNLVATVGDQDIDAQQFQSALQPALEKLSQQFGGHFDLAQAKKSGFVNELLEHLVSRSVLDQEAHRLGLAVSDAVVRGAIFGNPEFKGANGQFDRARFAALLAANNLREGQFVAKLRQDIPIADLLHAVTVGAVTPPPVIDALYRYEAEKREADIVTIPAASVHGIGAPSETDLRSYYEKHKGEFRAPEYRGFTLASLTPQDLAPTIKIPEATLKQAYQDRRYQFMLPARRDVQQILAPSHKIAKQAAAALAAGKSWNEVATTIAKQPPGTINLGLVAEKDLPGALGETAFSLPLNKPSPPIKSSLGWHILRVVKIEPAHARSFSEVKSQLEQELALREAAKRIYNLGGHVDDAIAGGATLAAAAKKFGLKVTTVPAADESGQTPAGQPIKLPVPEKPILQRVFAADQGQTSRVYNTDAGAIYVVSTGKVIPPHIKSLAEVKATVSADWKAEKRHAAVLDEARALAAAVNPTQNLKAAAAAKKLTVASKSLSRQTGSNGKLPPTLIAKIFSAKKGGVVTAADAQAAYVAQLGAIEMPKPNATNTAILAEEIERGLKTDIGGSFNAALRTRYPVAIHQQTIDKLF